MREAERRLRPRRGRCRELACPATHVPLPDVFLARRLDAVEVIGEALLAGDEGSRRVAERPGCRRSQHLEARPNPNRPPGR